MATIAVQENRIEYYGHTLRALTVLIDGQLVSDSFQVFDASCEAIASRICEECYAATGGAIATCGHEDIAVRRHEDGVYWFLADHEHVVPLIENVALSHVWGFPQEQYEGELGGCADELPDFEAEDVRMLLNRATIYRPELGLFTIPDVENDSQGRLLLDVIAGASQANDLEVCSAPEQCRTIRIGIETEGIPEVIVETGIANRRRAFRLVSGPSLPVWLTSDGIHDALAGIAM